MQKTLAIAYMTIALFAAVASFAAWLSIAAAAFKYLIS